MLKKLSTIAGKLVGASRNAFADGEFEGGVARLLAEHNIEEARMVGGLFTFSDQTRTDFRRMNLQLDWSQGAVFVADTPDGEKAYALMAGRQENGEFSLKSIHNIGRPDDISPIDKLTARRIANGFRNQLIAGAELTVTEADYLFKAEAHA